MTYKISKDSQKELQRAISKFNSKVKRLESVDREIDIPEKESIKAIKERVSSKWDLNREIDRLERFTKRNAEELIQNKAGVVKSRWEFENLQREQKRLSARLSREIERYGDIKPTIFGEKQVATYSQMGDERLTNLKARRNAIKSGSISKLDKQSIKDLETLINKTSAIYRRDKSTFYDSYLDGTLLNLAYQTGYDKEKIKYIREKLKELNENQFIKAFNTEAGLKDLQDKYIISKEQGVRIEDISEDVNNILDEVYKSIDTIVNTYK
jgi:hypothetical protein